MRLLISPIVANVQALSPSIKRELYLNILRATVSNYSLIQAQGLKNTSSASESDRKWNI